MRVYFRRGLALLGLLASGEAFLGMATPVGLSQALPPRQLSQGQAATQFLRAVLRAEYLRAYQGLAPEVRRTVSLEHFTAAARPLWKAGKQRRPAIELYKLGVRLGDGGASRLFYSFSFASDSVLKTRPVLLEVTFRDTAARTVLGFGMKVAKKTTATANGAKIPPKH
jgi:hypothetical protein